jgi:pantoate--beta-alanine ligase
MEILRTPAALRAWSDREHAAGRRVVLVPTMGYLHAGHVQLAEDARAHGERVVASIFVNPTQFGPNEDFARYPRDEPGDFAKLRSAGTDAVFAPLDPKVVYAPGFDTYVVPEKLAGVLCGASRPGHFRGVCTVVLLLFRMSRCDTALFGRKDYQQLKIIERMTKDLWLDVTVVGVPTVREPDGLAMSSRNAYLSPEERRRAVVLSRTLQDLARRAAGGERDVKTLLRDGRAAIEAEGLRIDYLELADAESLQYLDALDRPAVAAVAAFAGKTRLIDNFPVPA